jgi:phosphoribosylanthranilate isomerase
VQRRVVTDRSGGLRAGAQGRAPAAVGDVDDKAVTLRFQPDVILFVAGAFLAGGLRRENAARAIREVDPFVLDLCRGVRTNGPLDEAKLRAFFAAVNGAGDL